MYFLLEISKGNKLDKYFVDHSNICIIPKQSL